MKKSIILFIIPFILFATDTRVNVMGGENGLMLDVANIHTYPSTIPMFSGVIIGELGHLDQFVGPQSGIAIIPFGKLGTGSFILHRNHFPVAVDSAISRSGMPGDNVRFEPFFDVIYALKIKWFSFAFKYESGGSHFSDDQPEGDTNDVKAEINFQGYGGGISTVFKVLAMDFSFMWRNAEFNYETFTNIYRNTDKGEMDINFRTFILPENKISIPLFFRYKISKAGWEILQNDSPAGSENIKFSNMDLGAGVMYKPFERVSFLSGITYRNKDETYMVTTSGAGDTTEVKTQILPEFIFSGEGMLCKWLYGRAGITKSLIKNEIIETGTVKIQSLPYNFKTGLSFVFNDFWIDVELEDEFLFKGPFFIGGTENIAAGVSAGYKFH